MAAHIDWLPRIFGESTKEEPAQRKPRSRPLPLRLRTYSVAGLWSPGFDEHRDGVHARNKSLSVATELAEFELENAGKQGDHHDGDDGTDGATGTESVRTSLDSTDVSSLAGSPPSSLTTISSARNSLDADEPEVIPFEFGRLDYELERAKVLGQGLWSTVYLAEQKRSRTGHSRISSMSPLNSRSRRSRLSSTPSLFAVKAPSRRDAKDIFQQEARVLSHLQRRSQSSQYIVPFFGLDPRNHSLVFEAVIGGSLENLNSRLKQMTEVARHLELINIFPGIAYDLINGLEFLHSNGVVHADIKPGNILLDISEQTPAQGKQQQHHHHHPVVRARFIDFSAAFIPAAGDSASNAGGTWDYMAPEQLKMFPPGGNIPTFASDVWSLGVTLLYVLVGGSPWTPACGDNLFMLREAIKGGDPLQFARVDPVPRKRLAACQDFVDVCRLAVKKDREKRVSAGQWCGSMLEAFGALDVVGG